MSSIRRILFLLIVCTIPARAQVPTCGTYVGPSGTSVNSGTLIDSSTGDYVGFGFTNSSSLTTVSAFQSTKPGAQSGFLFSMESDCKTMRFLTYFGGSGSDTGTKVAQDGSGNIYTVGYTNSANFPHLNGTALNATGHPIGGFVAKWSTTGTLAWSTVLSSASCSTRLTNISFDSTNSVLWVVGDTTCTSSSQTAVYFAKISNLSSTSPTVTNFSSFPSAGVYDSAWGVAVNSAGTEVYIGGTTRTSSTAGSPVTGGAFQATCGTSGTEAQCTASPPSGQCANLACGDGFVAEVSTAGAIQAYTFLGGNTALYASLSVPPFDLVTSLAVDSSGHVYAVGTTGDTDFPTAGTPFQSALSGMVGTNTTYHTAGIIGTYPGAGTLPGLYPAGDGFVIELAANLGSEINGTYLGGSGTDVASKVSIDSGGHIWVSTSTQYSSGMTTTFPTTSGGFQITPNGSGLNMAISELSANLTSLLYGTYVGNGPDIYCYDSFVTSTLVACGGYSSPSSKLVTSSGSYQTSFAGTADGSIVSIPVPSGTQVATPVLSPLGPGPYSLSVSVTITDSTGSSIICYTTDGSNPASNEPTSLTCAHGTQYSTAVSISTNNTTLKAIGAAAGDTDSSVASSTYLISTPNGISVSLGNGATISGGAQIK